jgi:hypothetical protein
MSDDVEIEWIERDLRALDASAGEILVAAIHSDERPPGGVLSLIDWRMSGRISRHCIGGFLSGNAGERFLLPGRPRISFDKLLLIGVGPRSAADESAVREGLSVMIDALAALEVRRAAIDLPGRHRGVVTPSRALELLETVLSSRRSSLETVSVIDDREMSRAVEAFRTRPGRRNREGRR